jgi:PAS domain S-box-containing protein
MPGPLRLLIVEDSEDDALLILHDLKRGGFEPDFTRVDSAAAFRAAVHRGTWDIIVSDFNMPQFTGTDALKLLRATDQDTPFIFVSGTIGEDVAVEAMRAGAQDYVVKGNLKRLVPAIERELADAAVRRERRASEERYRLLFARHPHPLWLFDRETLRFLDVNEAAVRNYGYSREEFLGMTIEAIRPSDDVSALRDRLQAGQPGLHAPTLWRHRKKDGTVIDVEITSHDVDLHGRPTRLVSAIDDLGTTFKVYLPRVEAPAEAVREPAAPTGTPIGTETVLLAEDDAMLRPLARALLTKLGYRVLEASDSAAALAAARAHPGEIHLLISDVVMPGESGVQLARQIMAERPRLRVLYVSGYTDEAIVRHGVLEPGVNFLQKPFTPAALARKLREVLDMT